MGRRRSRGEARLLLNLLSTRYGTLDPGSTSASRTPPPMTCRTVGRPFRPRRSHSQRHLRLTVFAEVVDHPRVPNSTLSNKPWQHPRDKLAAFAATSSWRPLPHPPGTARPKLARIGGMTRADDPGRLLVDLLSAATGAIAADAEHIVTHGAVIVLDGDRAWKFKRPVAYRYMDFSTVERRRDALRAELDLNRRTAPQICLGVHAIHAHRRGRRARRQGRGPRLGAGNGPLP